MDMLSVIGHVVTGLWSNGELPQTDLLTSKFSVAGSCCGNKNSLLLYATAAVQLIFVLSFLICTCT